MLVDASPMPFGTHRGKMMQRVPANYLLWLADQMGKAPRGEHQRAVRLYVDQNRISLELEVLEKLARDQGPD